MDRILDCYKEFKMMYFMNEEQKSIDINYDDVNAFYINIINQQEKRQFEKLFK